MHSVCGTNGKSRCDLECDDNHMPGQMGHHAVIDNVMTITCRATWSWAAPSNQVAGS